MPLQSSVSAQCSHSEDWTHQEVNKQAHPGPSRGQDEDEDEYEDEDEDEVEINHSRAMCDQRTTYAPLLRKLAKAEALEK